MAFRKFRIEGLNMENATFEHFFKKLLSSNDLMHSADHACGHPIRCESEIECLLGAAIAMVLTLGRKTSVVKHGSKDGNERIRENTDVLVVAQAKIDVYRADFALFVSFEGKLLKTIIVECDGHDFHERTKEQAKRDRTKDRSLQQMGHIVLRFTGSEIWSDPFKCANEIYGVVDDLIVGAIYNEFINGKHEQVQA